MSRLLSTLPPLRQHKPRKSLLFNCHTLPGTSSFLSARGSPRSNSSNLYDFYHSNFHTQPQHRNELNRILDETNIADSKNEREKKTGTLILVRHGQSRWNVTSEEQGTTARFTGWADVGLTKQGLEQAGAAGRAIRSFLEEQEIKSNSIDVAFCSLLSRARDTLTLTLRELSLVASSRNVKSSNRNNDVSKNEKYEQTMYKIPVIFSWRLNERHYGALVGLSKAGAERLYGKTQLTQWRDGWDTPPPPMDEKQLDKWKNMAHTRAVTVVRDPGVKRTSYSIGTSVRGDEVGSIGDGEEMEEVSFAHSREFTILEKSNLVRATDSSTASDHGNNDAEYSPTLGGTSNNYDDDPQSKIFPIIQDTPPQMPASESLSDTCKRVLPIWIQGIAPRLRDGQTVLIVAHANTIRSIIYHIDPMVVGKDSMKKIKIPSATPMVYNFASHSNYLKYWSNAFETGIDSASSNSDVNEEKAVYIPGDLVLVPKSKLYSMSGKTEGGKNESRAKEIKGKEEELNCTWINTDDVAALSFCSTVGEKNLEGEIA